MRERLLQRFDAGRNGTRRSGALGRRGGCARRRACGPGSGALDPLECREDVVELGVEAADRARRSRDRVCHTVIEGFRETAHPPPVAPGPASLVLPPPLNGPESDGLPAPAAPLIAERRPGVTPR